MEAAMDGRQVGKSAAKGLAATAAIAAAGYAGLVILNRARYGKPKVSAAARKNSLLDQFIPDPEVVEHYQIAIAAPADVVLAAAKEMELLESPLVRAIIRVRELALGGAPDTRPHPTKLAEQVQSIGWVLLAERAGREVVFGAVTQPLGRGARISVDSARPVPRFQRAGLRQDRVDLAGRSG
jgi:hypothetical protein